MAVPVPLHADTVPEADGPGAEFNGARYLRELARSGVAKLMGGAYATLVTLVWHADQHGQAWPHMRTLAEELGCSRRQVNLDVKTLVGWGAIALAHRRTPQGGRRHLYVILPLDNIGVSTARHGLRAAVNPRPLQPAPLPPQSATPCTLQSATPCAEQSATPCALHKGGIFQYEHSSMNIPEGDGVQAPVPDAPTAAVRAASSPSPPEQEPQPQPEPAAPRVRKKPLRAQDPALHARREAIKERWYTLAGQDPGVLTRSKHTWLNRDAEALARATASTQDALDVMQAVYDHRWRDGTHPFRTPFRLSKVCELVKAYREGELCAHEARTPQEEEQITRFLDLFGEKLRPIGITDEESYRRAALRAIRAYGVGALTGCLCAMATSKRFVGQAGVSVDSIVGQLFTWQDAGQPRSWRSVEEWLERKAQRQGQGALSPSLR